MKRKIILAVCVLAFGALHAVNVKMSSYSINGAATHVIIQQSDDELVYMGEVDSDYAPVDVVNAMIRRGYRVKTPSLSYDARTIYFAAQSPAKADFDIYTSTLVKGAWSTPRALDETINSLHDEFSPSLSADGQSLYFIRHVAADPNVRKSEPTSTIFVASVREDGRYEQPIATLFSLGDEHSVAILPDNTTLLFTSQRPIGDSRPKVPHLYYSKRLPNNNWYDPMMIVLSEEEQRFVPFSPSYNSRTHMVCFLATTTDKKPVTTFYKLEQPESNFVLPLHHIQGKVSSTETGAPIAAQIGISDIMTNSNLSVRAHDDGFYAFALAQGHNTVIDFTAPQCSHQYLRVNTQEQKEDSYQTFDCQLSNQIELTLTLYDRFILEPIDATLRITNFENQPYRNLSVEKLSENSYRVVLPLGKAYRLQFNKEGYSPYVISLADNREILFNRSQLDIELLPFTKKTHFEVIDATTQERIEAEVEITNLQLPEKMQFVSLTQALVDTVLRASARYTASAFARGYLYNNQSIDMQSIHDDHTFTIALNPIVQGATMQLENVNFEYNSAEIMPASLSSLQQVLQLLETNPDVKIELVAHTDDRGNEQYNQKLSQRRAAAVRNYLIKEGISADRLQAVGYGKTRPLLPNTSDENRAKNRRVEFVIL